ncbi:restriction endonuclease-like protein [Bacillus phage Anath]|uniref:Restriction endonuclease-like protein n=1 Tax=Bacillus phage Anath TaxID=2108114 RepID=A0A2P1JUQ3_9CAUD|nr:restriction endonuclease-like protein [Bacillus phage Anath]
MTVVRLILERLDVMTKFGAKKVVIDGIKFDSTVEGDYYCHLLRLKRMGEIKEFTLQPAFVLLDGFEKHGKKHNPIRYKADFQVWYNDGTTKVIDVKGMKVPEFKLKEKLYAKQFDVELICISYSKMDGGWIEYDALQKARAKRKKEKEAFEKKVVEAMRKSEVLKDLTPVQQISHSMKIYKITKAVATRLLKEAKKPAKGTK